MGLPNEVNERLNFAATGLRSSVSISITSESELKHLDQRQPEVREMNDGADLSVEMRWLTTAHASSGRAFLIIGVESCGPATRNGLGLTL